MKIAIRYYTKSGHTKRLADALSEYLDIAAYDISKSLDEDVDILFLGSSVYGSSIDPAIIHFLNNINVEVGQIVNFSTAGVSESTYEDVKQIAKLNSINVSENEFHCPGEFIGMNKNRPNEEDITNFISFVKRIL